MWSRVRRSANTSLPSTCRGLCDPPSPPESFRGTQLSRGNGGSHCGRLGLLIAFEGEALGVGVVRVLDRFGGVDVVERNTDLACIVRRRLRASCEQAIGIKVICKSALSLHQRLRVPT